MLMFFWFMVSVADSTTATSRAPAASARSSPFWFGTSADTRSAGSAAWICGSRSAASAIWGTARGDTKLVASTLPTPAAARRRTSSSLSAVLTGTAWFCSPSRGLTSVMKMRSWPMAPTCVPPGALDARRGGTDHPVDAGRCAHRHRPDRAQRRRHAPGPAAADEPPQGAALIWVARDPKVSTTDTAQGAPIDRSSTASDSPPGMTRH
jgi:hypothetical protein